MCDREIECGLDFRFVQQAEMWPFGGCRKVLAFDGFNRAINAGQFKNSECEIIPAAHTLVAVVVDST